MLDWVQAIDFKFETAILFGSYAREDFNSDSDIDILLIHNEFKKPVHSGKYSISIYSKDKLMDFAKIGSLFILHLISEAKHLSGDNILPELEHSYAHPNFANFTDQLRLATQLLDVNMSSFNLYRSNLISVQKFILRSYLYSRNVKSGFSNFNINTVLRQIDLPHLEFVFDRSWNADMDYLDFTMVNVILGSLLDCKISNEYRSIESLIVNNYPKKNLLHTLGMSILKTDSVGIDYANLVING